MPFPDNGSLIPILLKHLGKGHELTIKVSSIYILVKPIDMTELIKMEERLGPQMLFVQYMVHPRTILSDAINVGGGCQICKIRVVGTDGLVRDRPP